MNTINSLTSLSAKTGIGGLVSGMDIDELVRNYTIISRQKILKEQQTVQKLQWKQTAYRSVTKALSEFQSSYLDLLSATNFRSSSFFNTKNAKASSTAISAIATNMAAVGDVTIDYVTQLAETQRISSGFSISKALEGKIASGTPGSLSADDIENLIDSIEGKSISLNLDGRLRTVTFDSDFVQSVRDDLSVEGLEEALQSAVDKAFGVRNVGERIIDVSLVNDTLSFSAAGSQILVGAVGGDVTTLAKLGFNNSQTNRVSLYGSLKSTALAKDLTPDLETFEFSINNIDFKFSSDNALADLIKEINSSDAGVNISYSTVTDTFVMTAKETGAGENIIIKEKEGNLLTALGLTVESGAEVKYGQNAILSVNGQEIQRNYNVFNIDGISIELNEATKEGSEPITISVTEDSSSLREPIEKFLEDYNALIDLMSGLISEKPNPEYPPLSEEQKSEMTEKQIEKWESEAKLGILRGDPVLRTLLSDLRNAMNSTAKDGGLRLFDIGISTGSYQDNGKLKIADEGKFLEALKTSGAEIAEMFSTAETGIANRLNAVLEGAIKKSGPKNYRGKLIELAGIDQTTSDVENNITKTIESANKRIAALRLRLSAEESRLWSKFTALETALQRLDVQNSMLLQFSFNGQ